MWLWQPRKHKHFVLWAHFLLCVTILHIVALIPLFIIHQKKNSLQLTLNKNPLHASLPVVFMPLAQIPPIKKVAVVTPTPKQVIKKEIKKPIPTAPKKELEKKKTVVQAEPQKKIVAKPPLKKAEIKKEVKKVEVAQAKVEEKKVAPVPEKQAEMVKPAPAQPDVMSAIDALYVSKMEMEQLAIEQYIQQEIGIHWRPPQGLADTLSCKVKLLVSATGSLVDNTIIDSSGVLLFDLSVKEAFVKARTINLPPWAYSREFFITFK